MKYYPELHNLLEEVSALLRPTSYLEIGVREGDSLKIVLGQHCPGKIYLCDNWGVDAGGTGRGNHDHIAALLEELHPEVHPVYLDGDSHVLLPTLTESFQMITVDGDHSEAGAARDLEDVWPRLELNGLLFFDDIKHPMHLYLDAVINSFVARHGDSRMLRRETYPSEGTPGCVIVQKIVPIR